MSSMEDLTYEWPPHVGRYEARFFGFTVTEAIAGTMGFLIPVAVLQSQGLIVGILGAIVALLFTKRMGRLGGVSLPIYLFYRLQAAHSQELLELPLITAHGHGGVVEIEDWLGGIVAVIE